jgi:hypothetical protein
MLNVKYLSRETYQEEISSDIDYHNLQDKLERYPQINENTPNYNNIKMSETGKYSVSKLDESFITTNEIKNFYNTFINKNEENKTITITDATANAGGNTIAFAIDKFNVNSIELSKKEFTRLANNISEYNLNNVRLFNGNCLDILFNKNLTQDVVYFDPPWGGTSYKQHKFIGLSLDDKDIGDHIDKLLEQNKCKLVVLKGPYNTFIKNKRYLNLSINIKLSVNKQNKSSFEKPYYNLYFFSRVSKSIVNSHYKLESEKNTIEQVNINPFSQNKNVFEKKLQKYYKFNEKWNIFNITLVISENFIVQNSTQTIQSNNQESFLNTINTIIVKNSLTLSHDLDALIQKFENAIVLSVVANKNHLDVFKNLVEKCKDYSDMCVVNNREVSIKKVYTYLLERMDLGESLIDNRIYFLKKNRIIPA